MNRRRVIQRGTLEDRIRSAIGVSGASMAEIVAAVLALPLDVRRALARLRTDGYIRVYRPRRGRRYFWRP